MGLDAECTADSNAVSIIITSIAEARPPEEVTLDCPGGRVTRPRSHFQGVRSRVLELHVGVPVADGLINTRVSNLENTSWTC